MDKDLEILTDKVLKSRNKISTILQKDFDLEQDFADSLAFSISVDAMGTEKYKIFKAKERDKKFNENLKKFLKYSGMGTLVLIAGYVVIWCLMVVGSSFVSWWNAPVPSPYPRVYDTIPDRVRFQEYKNASSRDGTWLYGLDNENQLCIENYKVYGVYGNGSAPTCLHPSKLYKVTDAMNKAVLDNLEGTIWEGDNGNGEYWIIERKNQRFRISAYESE
jgi:hypothetical protein